MNFDFSDEQKQLRDHARRFFTEQCPAAAVRAVLEGKAAYDRDLWKGLGELGFLGVAIPEEYGGTGASHLELAVLAEEAGRVLAPVPFFSSIYMAAEALMMAGSDEQQSKWLPSLASGELIGTFGLFEGPGNPVPASIQSTVRDGSLTGTKLPVPNGDIADVAVIAAGEASSTGGREIGLYIVDLRSEGVTRKRLTNIDPTLGQAEITFRNAPVQRLGRAGEGWRLLLDVLDRAAVLLAFEQVGGAERALEMARDYALERIAFGRQIGSFQAIKHMLADVYVATVLARSNAYYGAWAVSTNAPELAEAAAGARVSATHAFQLCAKQNIQVHGGMGFTWEVDCHLYYRRSNALAVAIGNPAWWEGALIDRMRANGHRAASSAAATQGAQS